MNDVGWGEREPPSGNVRTRILRAKLDRAASSQVQIGGPIPPVPAIPVRVLVKPTRGFSGAPQVTRAEWGPPPAQRWGSA
jgi:hypothetical protein